MSRIAWFSPMPPVPTGVATCSADLVRALGAEHAIDAFVDEPVVRLARGTRSAHEFVWRHQQHPYDLIVYQLGNSSHHDYIWPYLFRYPGLLVLHDARLHHARAAALLRRFRADDYRTEFAWNHPDASPDLAELAVAGFDNHLHYLWPMTSLAVRASRLVAVHRPEIADRLREESPRARIEVVRLGHGAALSPAEEAQARARTRARYGIREDAVVFGCYGGLTPAKRVPQVLAAFAATRASIPSAHLLLAGAEQPTYDVRADVQRLRLEDCTTLTGFVATDAEFTGCVAACDVAMNLRWPTAREVSGPWLHCLAMGKPTVVIDLAHLSSVPTLDPRTWQRNAAGPHERDGEPVAVALDILDEDHSLRLALRRLGSDADLRARLSGAARRYWLANHAIALMVDDYRRLIEEARRLPSPSTTLPGHLTAVGARTLERELERFGVAAPFATSNRAQSDAPPLR